MKLKNVENFIYWYLDSNTTYDFDYKRIAKSPKKLDYCDGPDPDDQRKTLKVKKKIPVFETYFQQFAQWMQI